MTVKSFIESCEIELQGLKSGDMQQVKDAIENLTCIPDLDLVDDMKLQVEVRRRFIRAFLDIVGQPKLNHKAWDAFNRLKVEQRHINFAVTTYKTGLALV